MIKVSTFLAESEHGLAAVPLFGAADAAFEKTASVGLLPEVTRYISILRPRKDAQYVLVNALGAGEYFGCFPAGTVVETYDGDVPIEDVPVGWEVRTHKNRYRKVVAKEKYFCDNELCDLYVQGLPSTHPVLTVTPNHELWVVPRDEFIRTKRRVVWKGDTSSPLEERRAQAMQELEFSWVPISDLRSGDMIAEPFPLEEDPRAFNVDGWNTPEIAFLMGLYAAEGCLSYRHDRGGDEASSVVFVVSEEETDVIAKAKAAAAACGHKLTVMPEPEVHAVRLQLSWMQFAGMVRTNIGHGALDKQLSPQILAMPRGWQRTFFEAYASGDGCVRGEGREEGTVRCVSASPKLLQGMRLLLARLGLAASISGRYNTKATWYADNPIFELSVSGGQLRGRGTPKSYIHPDGFILSSVKKVEQYAWSGDVYDLQVEEDSSYTASGVAVHNSNINGDHFPEEALMHRPDGWTGNPLIDKPLSQDWAYGFPTFYNAHAFAHHKNKDPSRAYGVVELSVWNDHMKRVELVVRVDHDKCVNFGGIAVWDRLKVGQFPDVSMGSRVPWDMCFPAGTLVRAEDGHIPIEELREGQRVVTHAGDLQQVQGTLTRTAEGTLRIRTGGLPDISATPNHPFLTLRKEDVRACQGSSNGQRLRHQLDGAEPCRRCGRQVELSPDWVAAEDLRVGDYVATPLPLPLPDVRRAAHSAKLLGYYLGDGYVVSQKTGKKKDGERRDMGVGFSVVEDDHHLPQLLSILSETGKNEPRVYEDRKGARAVDVILYNQELAAWVQHMGGRGSRGKRLASEVFTWSRDEVLDLVAGYVDTDGSFDEKRGSIRVSSVNRGLLLDVQRLLLGSNILCSVHVGGTTDGKDYWYLFIPAYGVQALLGRSFKVTPRTVAWQSSKTFLYGGFAWFPVEALEEIDEPTTVYNISVASKESYVAEGRAVHNCALCGDWKTYKKALATFDPKKHRHPGIAVLEYHKKLKAKDGVGIRGLSITRSDYCDHTSKLMNRIFPDGRKSFVYNFFPRFFDISFVFIGADRTAKVMVFIMRSGGDLFSLPSVDAADRLGIGSLDIGSEKTAGIRDDLLAAAFLKGAAEEKKSEIDKEVVPSQFAGKALPVLTKSEKDLPEDAMKALCSVPLHKALSTLTGLGMVLRPREFKTLLEHSDEPSTEMSSNDFMPALARILQPLMGARSGLGPYVERRIVMISSSTPESSKKEASSLSGETLRKIGSAYDAYRRGVMELVANTQDLIKSAAASTDVELHKLAEAAPEELFTPLAYRYLDGAFKDEVPFAISPEKMVENVSAASVERGLPSRNTWM